MEVLKRDFDKSKVKKSFRKVIGIYDFWGLLTERKAMKKVITLADIKDESKILEVACGTGAVFERIVKSNPNGSNIGVDLSTDMLDKAREKVNKIPGNYKLQEGDALDLKFDDNTFDILMNNYMVDLMPEETFDKVAQEFYRVLKKDGTVIMSTFSFGTRKIHKFWYWIAKKFPDLLTGCRPVSFKEYLADAGFNIEKVIQISQNTFPSEIIKARK